MKPLMTCFRFCLIGIFTAFSLGFGAKSTHKHPVPLFSGDEILEIRLAFSMDSLLADRGADPRYHLAKLSIKTGELKRDLDLKIKARGNFRLSPLNCDFPPIRLNFKEKGTEGTVFEGQDKLKLVTHCTDEAYVLREYLAYKTYQLISPHSFCVRLAKVTYVDVDRAYRPVTRYAFFVENKKALADRLGGTLIEEKSPVYTEAETEEAITAKLYLFQYLLGNRDWDIAMKKNIKIVQTIKDEVIPVPYDFDFTGWVNAPYTTAYMGDIADDFEYRAPRKFCLPDEVWQAHIQQFMNKKAEIMNLIENFEYCNKREKTSLIDYVESFFEEIKKPQKAHELFGEGCE